MPEHLPTFARWLIKNQTMTGGRGRGCSCSQQAGLLPRRSKFESRQSEQCLRQNICLKEQNVGNQNEAGVRLGKRYTIFAQYLTRAICFWCCQCVLMAIKRLNVHQILKQVPPTVCLPLHCEHIQSQTGVVPKALMLKFNLSLASR